MTNARALWTSTLFLCMCSSFAHGNLILNPSFEDNQIDDNVEGENMSNEFATSNIANFTAFGAGNEIDLTTGTGFLGSPQDGNWFATVRTTGNGRDAFSLDLSSSLVAGNEYTLSFFATGFPAQLPGVDVGVSSSPDSFGTLVFSTFAYPPLIDSWTQFTTTFTPAGPANYLTVRSGAALSSLASLDNFTLVGAVAVPEPSLLAAMGISMLGATIAAKRRRRTLQNTGA